MPVIVAFSIKSISYLVNQGTPFIADCGIVYQMSDERKKIERSPILGKTIDIWWT